MEHASRRSKRTRVAVDYARLDSTGFSDCVRVQHKRLARAVLKFEELPSVDSYCVDYVGANQLADHVHSTGFRNPCVVRASDVPPSALGIRVPEGVLTVERIADLVGRNRQINTIDVTTQSEGPMYTMQEWVDYFATPSPRKPLLNVVSLDLDNTSLQAMVSAPTLVKELDLVDKAWPASVSPSPKVQLYTLMSAAGCFMDFHVDFGGSSVWYHVLSGRKVFLVVPPIRGNLMAFEEWASSDKQGTTEAVDLIRSYCQQSKRFLFRDSLRCVVDTILDRIDTASVFFADRTSGCQKLELGEGDTLLLPGGWPHCVVTPMDSIVLGGNFLAAYNLSLQLDIWQMEERLKVRSKFRFPFYKELMWHTATTYLKLLKEDASREVRKVTKWERDGVHSLTRWLSFWLSQIKDGDDVPKDISQRAKLLVEELVKYTKGPATVPLDSNDCTRTRIVVKPPTALQINIPKARPPDYSIQIFEDNDEEYDPGDECEDDDDEDFSVDQTNACQIRPKSKKLSRRTCVNFSGPKTVISSSPQSTGSPGTGKRLTKSSSQVRGRLLKKCGFDPRIPLPSPKYQPKVERDSS